ncbi:glycosyltransferase family 2 protein [Saccharobesus litoralis]|uniref:Glycosyltransferase family 2 protein n=1 Tax=Saccharobesus litoralis TaxID=2172099 RepID=A0A2S0VVK3_9ALTE|nr:glycosyltransferase family 2 protein [Saccharobesus litoralis]AWB68254.1 glycosyltransferase family 2 protein [Saccharobesus litoralis]
MSNTPISVYFVTLNEAATIAQAIQSVQGFAEIIVVDSGSTDGTQQIATNLGAKVVHQDWLGFAKQKQYALSLCQHDWCFNLDGDEVVPDDVARQIQQQVDADNCDALRIYFEDVFMGAAMHPSSHKRSIVRVFKKQNVEYPTNKLVHENVKVNGKVQDVKGCVLHYGYADAETLMAKQNKYSSLGAQEKFNKGKRHSWLKLSLMLPIMFFKEYIVRKRFLSGGRGFVQAVIDTMYAFLKEAKLYELHKTKNKP